MFVQGLGACYSRFTNAERFEPKLVASSPELCCYSSSYKSLCSSSTSRDFESEIYFKINNEMWNFHLIFIVAKPRGRKRLQQTFHNNERLILDPLWVLQLSKNCYFRQLSRWISYSIGDGNYRLKWFLRHALKTLINCLWRSLAGKVTEQRFE